MLHYFFDLKSHGQIIFMRHYIFSTGDVVRYLTTLMCVHIHTALSESEVTNSQLPASTLHSQHASRVLAGMHVYTSML